MSAHVEIIAIGSELLTGNVVNSNAAFISRKLFEIGIPVDLQLAISDDPETMQRVLNEALKRSTLIITTGGLGPTGDDLTRQVIAKLTGSTLKLNQEIEAILKQRYGQHFPTLEDQATIPDKSKPLPNTVGTAPGLVFEIGRTLLIMLPGVPVEMTEMMTTQVIPFLQKKITIQNQLFSEDVHFHTLREADIDPLFRQLQAKHPELTFGIYPRLGTVTVRVVCQEQHKPQAREALAQFKNAHIEQLFQAPTVAEAIHQIFIEKQLTLSTAESCTGGEIAATLTKIPGASHYFLGSVVAYSNEIKTNLLHVPQKTVEQYGAVSKETVEAMLAGLLLETKSDYGIAVTGIAGPSGGTPEKPIGTLWCSIGKKDEKPITWKLELKGNREAIILKSVNIILGKLLQATASLS